MAKTTLKIRPPVILMECPLEEGYKTQQIGWGTRYDKRYKAFKVPFCPQTLNMIHRLFDNPVVVEGQEYIDEMKVRVQNNFDGRKAMSLTNYPRPEGIFKLPPYAHQKDGLWYLKQFYGAALFADCGCLAPETMIHVQPYRINKTYKLRIEDLFKIFKEDHPLSETFKTDMKNATYMFRIVGTENFKSGKYLRALDVKQSGIKPLFKITFASGKSIRATSDHEFPTLRGWSRLDHLTLADKVLTVSDQTKHYYQAVLDYEAITSISYENVSTMTYDIVCQDPYRNFIANGILVHNSGKTGMTLWDIEQKYKKGQLKPGSVLIVGKLMTLFSGWASDTLKFTDLMSEVLWAPSRSKDEREEIEVVCDHGAKPEGKSKSCTQTEYFHKNGEPAILSGPRAFNPKKHVRKIREWKEVNGQKYGLEKLVTARRINLRAEHIKKQIASCESSIHVINHEGLILFEKELAERKYEYIAIDESTAIKNPSAKIVAALNNIAKRTKYRRILSGTPSPQGPQDLWSQFYFLDEGLTLGPDYKEFLNQHFDMIQIGKKESGTYKGVKPCISPAHSRDTMGWVKKQLENRVFRCKLRNCIDLPPITISTLDVFLTPEQQGHYENMKEAFCAEVDGEIIEVTVDLAKIMKLRQITGGFILTREGEIKKVSKSNPKLEALKDFISSLPKDEKVVIFAIYRAEIEMLMQYFGKEAVAIYGGVSDVKKLNAQDQFINNPAIHFIVCQPQSAAYGVNGLTIARYLLFYSIDYRSDTDYQAIKRIERNGQTRAMFVYYLIAKNTIDEIIYRTIKIKDRIQQKTIDVKIVKELSGIRSAEELI